MSETPRQRRPRTRLYGRSKGKALRKRQAALIEALLPRLSLDLSQPSPSFARETHLEIGFGGGEHLIAAAAENPQVDFIGCEPFINGVAKLLARIEERGLANVRLHQGDAADVLDWLPDDSLGRVYLFYPDPWPKRRHRKRRFVARDNLDRLARVMHTGAELRFATDIDDYAAWTLARLRAHPAFAWRAQRADDWRTPWPGWTRTKYEAKAMADGRHPVYLTFVRAPR
ncbi:MAG: tRNA (guanosine(46)-N7)-methyltransferase TrmB [Alphaproteobacteria bacterium]|nr:tRNA (guanosine(46)-N7)-methyltransferase TrmB [Alphaproteobacteria bacterium]MBM3651610.1 tRNA (guanosine(46)-N7)-methyltransferase TrmB [Alphaproteobacteria bacterium]